LQACIEETLCLIADEKSGQNSTPSSFKRSTRVIASHHAASVILASPIDWPMAPPH